MNCQRFETVIVDLADERLMDAATRAAALAHADACALCAARLSAERKMTARLNVAAAHDEAVKAPDRLKLALEAAFDEQFARQTAQVVRPDFTRPAATRAQRSQPSPQVSRISQISAQISWTRWGLAAAAAALLFLAVAASLMTRQGEELKAVTTPPGATTSPSPRAAEPQREEAAPPTAGENQTAPAPQSKPSTKRRSSTKGSGAPPNALAKDTTGDDEQAAEFHRLTPLSETGPQEFEQVVRIEVPRSTLMMWGVPVNGERAAAERVKADVVIGEDGVARAIRILDTDSGQ
jgi:hypothetical protein